MIGTEGSRAILWSKSVRIPPKVIVSRVNGIDQKMTQTRDGSIWRAKMQAHNQG